jgi:hypothetical protein
MQNGNLLTFARLVNRILRFKFIRCLLYQTHRLKRLLQILVPMKTQYGTKLALYPIPKKTLYFAPGMIYSYIRLL